MSVSYKVANCDLEHKRRLVVGNELAPERVIEPKIFMIRGHRVMLDRDLAELYGVETKALIQAVKRNIERFPEDCVPRTYMEARKEA